MCKRKSLNRLVALGTGNLSFNIIATSKKNLPTPDSFHSHSWRWGIWINLVSTQLQPWGTRKTLVSFKRRISPASPTQSFCTLVLATLDSINGRRIAWSATFHYLFPFCIFNVLIQRKWVLKREMMWNTTKLLPMMFMGKFKIVASCSKHATMRSSLITSI